MTLNQLLQIEIDRLNGAIQTLHVLRPQFQLDEQQQELRNNNLIDAHLSIRAREELLKMLNEAKRLVSAGPLFNDYDHRDEVNALYRRLFVQQDNPVAQARINSESTKLNYKQRFRALHELVIRNDYADHFIGPETDPRL